MSLLLIYVDETSLYYTLTHTHRSPSLSRVARTRYRAQVMITHGWFRWKRTKVVKRRAKVRQRNDLFRGQK